MRALLLGFVLLSTSAAAAPPNLDGAWECNLDKVVECSTARCVTAAVAIKLHLYPAHNIYDRCIPSGCRHFAATFHPGDDDDQLATIPDMALVRVTSDLSIVEIAARGDGALISRGRCHSVPIPPVAAPR